MTRAGTSDPGLSADPDEDRAWSAGLYPHLDWPRPRPKSVPVALWPETDTAGMGADLLSAPLSGDFLAYEPGGLGAVACRAALSRAGRLLPGEARGGILARVGVPLLAGEVALAATAACLDQAEEFLLGAAVRELGALIWSGLWPREDFNRRMALARLLRSGPPRTLLPVNLDPIATLAVCNENYVQGALRALLRDLLHHERLFRPPFDLLRQAMTATLHVDQ